MAVPFLGSEAVASGEVRKSALRTRYHRLFPDVYIRCDAELSPQARARAGWLWSRRRGIVAGLAASALHGARWVDPDVPLDILHVNRNPRPGIRARGDRIATDEVMQIGGIPVTTPARTALDLGCWYPTGEAVAAIDSLMRAADVGRAQIETLLHRYPTRRWIRRARRSVERADPGAQSPKETWLRLLLLDDGLPRPQTQIRVADEWGELVAYLDMGWEELMVAVEYDGEQHRNDRRQYSWDIRRKEILERLGWTVIRVLAGDRPTDILRRVRAALVRRASR